MAFGDILSDYTYIFILTMVRYGGLFLLAPVFSSRVIPLRIKVGLTLFLAVVTMPGLVDLKPFPTADGGLVILLDVIRELSIGFAIGYIANLTFAAVELAGRFIDLRMGFAMVNIFDPIRGDSQPMMGQFKSILAILLFLGINGHHILLDAIYQSFKLVPLAGAGLDQVSLGFIFRITGNLFLLAFQIALPVMATLFVADIIFGFLARTIPQINIFIVGLPMKILIGFVVIMFSLHFTIYFFNDLFQQLHHDIFNFIKMISQGGEYAR